MSTFRGLCSSRINDDELGSFFERLVDEDGLMDVGLGGVLSPHDDELSIGQVPRRGVPVVAQSQSSRLEAGGPAEIAVGRRVASEETPETVRDAIQNAFGATSFIEKDALWAVLGSVLVEPFGNRTQDLVPRDGVKVVRSGATTQGVKKAVRRMDPLHVAQSFQARSLDRRPVLGMGLEFADPAVLDVNAHATSAVTIPWAGCDE